MKKAPFLRFNIPFMCGIVFQWYLQLPPLFACILLAVATIIFSSSFFLSYALRYKMVAVTGIAGCFIFLALGILLTRYKDVQHNYPANSVYDVTLQEDLIQKPKSF